MIPAIHRAKALYLFAKVPEPFEVDLGHYLRYGYVVVRPDLFIMGKPMWMNEEQKPESLDDLQASSSPNVWYIHMMVGSIREGIKYLPFPLPWIAFNRHFKKKLKVWPLDKFILKLVWEPL